MAFNPFDTDAISEAIHGVGSGLHGAAQSGIDAAADVDLDDVLDFILGPEEVPTQEVPALDGEGTEEIPAHQEGGIGRAVGMGLRRGINALRGADDALLRGGISRPQPLRSARQGLQRLDRNAMPDPATRRATARLTGAGGAITGIGGITALGHLADEQEGGQVQAVEPPISALGPIRGDMMQQRAAAEAPPGPLDIIAEAQDQAASQIDELDGMYDQELEQLRSMYELSETPEERAQIQYLLDDLEARREAGQQVIDQAFSEAVSRSDERAADMYGQAEQAGERVGDIYRESAADTAGLMEGLGAEMADPGFGLGSGVGGAAPAWVDSMASAAPAEQAHAEQMFGLGAQDVEALGAMMEGEGAAQQADLQRQAMMMGTDAQANHASQVNNRIAQERAQLAGQTGDLMGERRRQESALEDEIRSLGLQAAEILEQRRRDDLRRQQEMMGGLGGLDLDGIDEDVLAELGL